MEQKIEATTPTHELLPLQEHMEGPAYSSGEVNQATNYAATILGAEASTSYTTTTTSSSWMQPSPKCVKVNAVPDSSSSSSSSSNKKSPSPSTSSPSGDLITLDPNSVSNGTAAGAAGTSSASALGGESGKEEGADWEWVSATGSSADKENPDAVTAAEEAATAVQAALTATTRVELDSAEQSDVECILSESSIPVSILPDSSDDAMIEDDNHNAGKDAEEFEDPNFIMHTTGTIGGTVLDGYAELSDSDSYCAELWEDMMDESTLDPSPHAYYLPFRRYMAKILSPTARKFLSDHLNPDIDHLSRQGVQKNWCGLVECMGKDYAYVANLDRYKDPTKELLRDWQTEGGSTIGRLLIHLHKMDRFDVIDDLGFMDMIKRSAIAYDREREQQANEREQRRRARIAKKRGLATVGDVELGHLEEYHSFICYDESDNEFIKEMIYECEELKGLKICINVRDLLADQNENHMTAEMIKKRCGRTIVVLSERFCTDNSDMFEYAMRISQALSPGTASRGKVIPVKLDDCEVPNCLTHITPVDFSRCRERMWLWRKVTTTLKTSHDSIAMMERQRLRHVVLYEDNRADLRAEMKAEGYKLPIFEPPEMKPYVPPRPKSAQELMMIGDNERVELRRPPYIKEPVLTIPQKIRRKFRRFFRLENAWDPEFRW